MSNSFDAVSRFGSVPGAGFMGNGSLAKSGAWLQELERAALGNRPQAAESQAQHARGAAPQAGGDAGGAMAPAPRARQAADKDEPHAREGQGGAADAGALASGPRGQQAMPATHGAVGAAPAPVVAPRQGQGQGAAASAELAHVGLLTMALAAPDAPPAQGSVRLPDAVPSLAAGAMPGAPLMANPGTRAAGQALPGDSGAARVAPAGAPPARMAAHAPMLREQAEASEAPPEHAPASGGESAADEVPYALRSMHLFREGDGVQAWIRDAALSQFQANALAYSLKKEMQAEGLTLNALTLNGKKTALAPAPPPQVKRT
ncbi:MAG TPA: hypothetical protein VF800_11600 [Telluria sp.]|jgi:hypothetical protein